MLPSDAQQRKDIPIYRGFIKYFPDAIVEVTKLSVKGSKQHHGDKVWWDKSKSSDELDALMRHLLEGDWVCVAWRAMANLQRECDERKRTQEIALKFGELYPQLCPIEEAEDTYSPFDFECSLYIIEIKARDTDYPDWVIEQIKVTKNSQIAKEKGKDFLYLTEFGGTGYVYNITKLLARDYDFRWQVKRMPETTEFSRTNWVDKDVGFLLKEDATIIKLEV